MGLIWSKFWSLFGKEEHKIVFIGLDNAGKTTIAYHVAMGEVVQTTPTIGSNVEEIVFNNIHFQMWDLGGQQSLRSAWNTYFANTEFLIVVIDSTDKKRLPLIKDAFHKVINSEEMSNVDVLVFANKQDLKNAMNAEEITNELDLTSIRKQHWHIQACCALTGLGLEEGFEWISERLRNP